MSNQRIFFFIHEYYFIVLENKLIFRNHYYRQQSTSPYQIMPYKSASRRLPAAIAGKADSQVGHYGKTFLSPFNFRTRYQQRLNAVSNYLELRLKSLAWKTDKLLPVNIFLQTCLWTAFRLST